MKKLFLVSLLCGFTLFSAQIDFSNTRYGVTAGGTYSRIRNAHNPSGARFSFYGGFLALIPVDSNDQFFIQTELEYLGAGESGKDKDAKGKPGYDAVYGNNYISVPIFFKGYFSEAESEFFGILGPRFNFLLNQTIKNAPLNYTVEGVDLIDTNGNPYNVNGKAAGFNLALGFGIGYSYKRQLEITGRYDIGLSNTYPGLLKEKSTDPNVQKKKSEQVLSIGLSYIFQ